MSIPITFYIVTVEYNGVPYNSDFIRLSAAQPEQNQPFTVFNTTSDPSVVVIDELRMFIEFLADDVMRVSEFYLFGNNGDAVLSARKVIRRKAQLRFSYPPALKMSNWRAVWQ